MSDQVVLELGDDFALEQVNETLIPKINDIKMLSNLMSQIKYGFYSYEKEENVTSGIEGRMKGEYRLQAPETTIQKKVGLCWDTVLVSKYYLNKLGYQTKLFYFRTPDNKHTHTVTFFKELRGNNKNVKWHWYEWSWTPFINKDYNADTWEELLYSCAAFQWAKSMRRPVQVFSISRYPKVGVGPDTFVEDIVKNKFLGTVDATNCQFTPAGNKATEALEDYIQRDAVGNVSIVTETVESVFDELDKKTIYSKMNDYVDDQLDKKECEHILRHYIANCLQHQWWTRFFTAKLGHIYYLNGETVSFTYGRNKKATIVPAGLSRLMQQMYRHDFDKLHNIDTVAAYAVRVYNQHFEEGADITHSLKINAMGEEAINKAWANHIKTNVHHPECWDRHYVVTDKDLPDNELPPCHAEKMPVNALIEMAGDWMSASLLRHKTAKEWYDKTVGKRFFFSDEQRELLQNLFSHEDALVDEVMGLNPFASEGFGADSDVVPADLHEVREVGGTNPGTVVYVNPVTGEKKAVDGSKLRRSAKDMPGKPSPEFDPNVAAGIEKYEPPYNAEQMRQNGYSEEIIKKLEADPVHKWRMDTGIELIHREPSKSELQRIWKNWQQMTPEQKKKSDAKCKELFGCDNEKLYNFLIVQYKTETPNKDDIKYPSAEDLAQEALGGSKSKKQRIIDYVVGCLDLIDPTKDNSRRFSDMVNVMNDKQFAEYMQNLIDHKVQIDIIMPNMKKHLQMNDIFAAAKKINCKLFDRVWFYDLTTGKEFLSTEELPIFRVTVRRQEQMLDEKLSVPDSAQKIDAMTGQVTGDDRKGGFSQPEIQIMYSKGFKNVLKEFVKIRGGDVHAFADFERQLEEQGTGSMDQIKVVSRARSGAVLSTWLEAIHLENNI